MVMTKSDSTPWKSVLMKSWDVCLSMKQHPVVSSEITVKENFVNLNTKSQKIKWAVPWKTFHLWPRIHFRCWFGKTHEGMPWYSMFWVWQIIFIYAGNITSLIYIYNEIQCYIIEIINHTGHQGGRCTWSGFSLSIFHWFTVLVNFWHFLLHIF